MAKLPRFTVSRNGETKRWDLVDSSDKRTVKTFVRKSDAP